MNYALVESEDQFVLEIQEDNEIRSFTHISIPMNKPSQEFMI